MVDIYVSTFYIVTVSTQRGDADAQTSCLFADSFGPEVSYDYASQVTPGHSLLVRSVFDVPVGSEPLVNVWARCACQLPTRQQPQAVAEVDWVSVSVHECADSKAPEQTRLLEHLVANKQGATLHVEFSNETVSIDFLCQARESYVTSYELAVHAASSVMQRCSPETLHAFARAETEQEVPKHNDSGGSDARNGGKR